MALPDRPVDGAEIATEWGQEIHDRVFAPSGCEVHSATTGAVGTTPGKLHLDTVIDDPGGYLDAADNQVEVPTDRGGLYQVFVRCNAVNGDAGTQTRVLLYLNGVSVSTGIEDNNGGTNITVTVAWAGILSAGDILTVYGQRRGSGTNPAVKPQSLLMYRVGAELGA